MTDLEFAKDMLSQGHTCAAYNGTSFMFSDQRGVAPLLKWLEDKRDLSEFSVADKVIGRGAAFLYVLLGAKNIFAHVISASALELLISHGIRISYDECVPRIINRAGTGVCPIEESLMNVNRADEALSIIKNTLKKISKGDSV